MTDFVANLAQLQMKTTSFVGKRLTTISNKSEVHESQIFSPSRQNIPNRVEEAATGPARRCYIRITQMA